LLVKIALARPQTIVSAKKPAPGRYSHYTMEISDQLRCLFSGTIDEQNESYRIKIPENEVQLIDVLPRLKTPASHGTAPLD